MGCSISRLEDEEAVKLCRDRKKFIKQAVEYRTKFAMGHIAYIDSLKRVSAALCSYVEEDEPREYLLDSYTTDAPPLIANDPVKRRNNDGFISFSPNALSEIPIQPKSKPKPKSRSNSREKPVSLKINYLMAGGNPAVTVVEERPQSSETFYNLENYSTMGNYGFDGFFSMQTPQPPPPQSSSSSFFPYSPNYDSRPSSNLPPPSPRNSQWDFFWNPFSSFDYYGYPNRTSFDRPILDDDVAGLRQVREEEGIPELEEETEHEDSDKDKGKGKPTSAKFAGTEEVTVEDDDDEDEDDDDEDDDDDDDEDEDELSSGTEDEHDLGKTKTSHGNHEKMEVSRLQKTQEKAIDIPEDDHRHQTPGFTVYVNRRPTSMNEVIKGLEKQFQIAVTAASNVSAVLEPNRSYSLHSNETTVMKMLNPVALIRSSSSRSSSSRFLTYKDDGSDEESCSLTGSHQSTLDRLYAWEKKLYDEVKAGEKVRIAYEKKSAYLKSQDARGELTLVEKTRAAMRDLHTQIKVSFHSIESISKRIEDLRDKELQPQLLELVQGLSRMWKAMAECHQVQKRILDEAKVLLASAGGGIIIMPSSEPYKMARAASNLETELRNWQATFKSWIVSQRSYVQALTSWLHHGRRSSALSSSSSSSSIGAPPIFGLCKEWSRFLNVARELKVIDGLDFFAAGVGSVYDQHLREDSRSSSSRRLYNGGGNMEIVEAGAIENEDENGMKAEKVMELAMRVLCAGMSVAVSSLTEYAIGSTEGYCDLMKRSEGLNSATAS